MHDNLVHIAVATKFNSGIWRRVFWQISMYVSKEPAVSIELKMGAAVSSET